MKGFLGVESDIARRVSSFHSVFGFDQQDPTLFLPDFGVSETLCVFDCGCPIYYYYIRPLPPTPGLAQIVN